MKVKAAATLACPMCGERPLAGMKNSAKDIILLACPACGFMAETKEEILRIIRMELTPLT